jgi:dephospho-CoA kinase
MVRIGLTGGIGSGKTAASDELARLGAVIIDADLLARDVVAPGSPGLHAIADRFGSSVVIDGAVDRAALGKIIFADPIARGDLESIIHPAVRARAAEIERTADPNAVLVHVIPLLVETGQADDFDLCVVIDVDHETQRDRLRARTRWTDEEIDARIASQATRAERLAVADVVIDNGGTVTQLKDRIARLWARVDPSQQRD